MYGDSFFASRETEVFRGGGFYRHAIKCNPESMGKLRPHLWDMRGESGALRDHDAVEVAADIAVLPDERFHLAEQREAVRTLVTGVGVWKMLAEVAERKGTEQGIHHGMAEDIGVGVALQPAIMGNLDPAENELTACGKGVNVKSASDSKRHQQRQMRVRGQSKLDGLASTQGHRLLKKLGCSKRRRLNEKGVSNG